MLYEMNKEAHIVIETPVRITYSITVHETTIWSKIVQCGNREEISTHITPELTIGAPVYVTS